MFIIQNITFINKLYFENLIIIINGCTKTLIFNFQIFNTPHLYSLNKYSKISL